MGFESVRKAPNLPLSPMVAVEEDDDDEEEEDEKKEEDNGGVR